MVYVNILVLEWGENQKDLDDAKTNLKEVETKLLEYEFILETFKQSVFRTSVIFIFFDVLVALNHPKWLPGGYFL